MNTTPQEAFPTSWYDNRGMTLLDYFAAKALAAILHATILQELVSSPNSTAETAYIYARAMMEARKAGTSSE